MNQNVWQRCGWTCLVLVLMVASATADDEKPKAKPTPITLGRNKDVVLEAPANWISKKPRFNMIEYEFSAPSDTDGLADARVTVMGAGGDVKQNIARWKSQFHDQGLTFSTKQLKIAGQEVHMVDIAGTYLDRPAGPMVGGKVTPRENYRVLAAILVTTRGRYYLKMYGPQPAVAAHEKAFQAMIETLRFERP